MRATCGAATLLTRVHHLPLPGESRTQWVVREPLAPLLLRCCAAWAGLSLISMLCSLLRTQVGAMKLTVTRTRVARCRGRRARES